MEKGGRTPVILYADYSPELESDRLRLAGLRRYATARKWRVETLEHQNCSPAALRKALARLRPIGCAVECWCPQTALKPALFGRVPVVYFSPPDGPGWEGARGVRCDEAAVAEMAFRELSAGQPPAYAVMSCWKDERWARERVAAFRECCRKAGADCTVACFADVGADCRERFSRMAPWAAALPPRCAVFAVNDCCARCAAKVLAESGRPPPRTVTLVGVDGVKPRLDREVREQVSTVRLDFELAGYLAAKALCAFAANEGPPHFVRNEGSRKREIKGAASAANSFGGKAASLHCGEAAPSMPPPAAPSLVFPPLLVDRRKSTRGYGRREPRILEAMEIIRREACDGLTVSALARRFHGTRRLFDMRFREAAGHSALDEIMNVRMARAMELLSGTDMPVSAVADFCGFNTELAFWKVFRRRVGVAPLEFRRARK